MRVLAIGLLAAALSLTIPNPALALNQSKHHSRHAVQKHHWFWQHWHLHQRKPKSTNRKR